MLSISLFPGVVLRISERNWRFLNYFILNEVLRNKAVKSKQHLDINQAFI